MTIWRMRISLQVPKATNTHSEYVIWIAFPQQKWLHELASILRKTFIACLVNFQSVDRNTFLMTLHVFLPAKYYCVKMWLFICKYLVLQGIKNMERVSRRLDKNIYIFFIYFKFLETFFVTPCGVAFETTVMLNKCSEYIRNDIILLQKDASCIHYVKTERDQILTAYASKRSFLKLFNYRLPDLSSGTVRWVVCFLP